MTADQYTDPQVGDIVTSRWSSAGAKWRVEEVGPELSRSIWSGRVRYRELRVRSVKSGRRDTRRSDDVELVERPA